MCAFVDKHRDEHGVEPICKALQMGLLKVWLTLTCPRDWLPEMV